MRLIIVCLLLSLQGSIFAQQVPESAFPKREFELTPTQKRVVDNDLTELSRSNEQVIQHQQYLGQVFDQEIDSTKYILGPGDQLLVKTWGVLEGQSTAVVTPEGFIILPSVAEINVGTKTLAEASAEIRLALRQKFTNSSFSVRLIQMRKFRVFVVGEVVQPGTYFLRPVDRISDALDLAAGLANWGDDTRIEIRRRDGETLRVNVSDFITQGSLEDNPFVQGGDVVYVPPIDLSSNYVVLEGNVGSQGIYQIRPNETLYHFLTRLRTINRTSNIEEVIVDRGGEREVFNLFNVEDGATSEVLQKGDRIIVPTLRNEVYVKGEVISPGAFPYRANYLSRDYAGLAGMTDNAKDPKSLVVIRHATGEVFEGDGVVIKSGDTIVVRRVARETIKDYLSILAPLIGIVLSVIAINQATKN